ncbi:hypothetical protein FOZ62_019047, partial [Perkinsus olseni]
SNHLSEGLVAYQLEAGPTYSFEHDAQSIFSTPKADFESFQMGGNRFSSGCDRLFVDPPPKLSPSLSRLQEKLNFDGFVSAPGGFGYELAVGDWLSEARHQGIETEVTAVVTSIDQRELPAVMRYCNSEGTALGLIGDARELLASSPALKASAVKRSLICYSIAPATRCVNVSTGDGGSKFEHFVASGCIMFGSSSESGRGYDITSVVCDLLFDVDELRRKSAEESSLRTPQQLPRWCVCACSIASPRFMLC